jgi:hypothetical protein
MEQLRTLVQNFRLGWFRPGWITAIWQHIWRDHYRCQSVSSLWVLSNRILPRCMLTLITVMRRCCRAWVSWVAWTAICHYLTYNWIFSSLKECDSRRLDRSTFLLTSLFCFWKPIVSAEQCFVWPWWYSAINWLRLIHHQTGVWCHFLRLLHNWWGS